MKNHILGICCFGITDSGVCLLEDGKIVFAAEGERYTRVKHDNSFPREAVLEAIKIAGIQAKDIDYVGFYTTLQGVPLQTLRHLLHYFPRSLLFLRNIRSYLRDKSLEEELKKTIDHIPSIFPVKHHLAHACSSFYLSPYERAAILTLDGTGEFTTCTFGLGEGERIRLLKEIHYPHSLGKLYETFTQYLGFRPCSGEGKVMGLAAYGEPENFLPVFRKIVQEGPGGTFHLDMSFFSYHYGSRRMYSKKLIQEFGPPRESETSIEKRHQDIAAALQRRLEEIVLHMANELYDLTKSRNLCLAGGVCLNCQMNAVVQNLGPFKHLFVPPAAGDSGTAIGAAKYIYYSHAGGRKREVLRHAFLGAEFTEQECVTILEGKNLPWEKLVDPARACAELLSRGKIVGWFQGCMEIGPRALGNRSILADPRDPQMKDILNQRVKFREGFRPFAPAVLEDHCGDFFESSSPSPFMLQVYPVIPEKRNLIPAVVHVDGTCRVQTVNATDHPLFHEVIKHFQDITGIPVILNTSFNLRGEPIVRTPEDALDTFLRSHMDALFLGNLVVKKKIQQQRAVRELS